MALVVDAGAGEGVADLRICVKRGARRSGTFDLTDKLSPRREAAVSIPTVPTAACHWSDTCLAAVAARLSRDAVDEAAVEEPLLPGAESDRPLLLSVPSRGPPTAKITRIDMYPSTSVRMYPVIFCRGNYNWIVSWELEPDCLIGTITKILLRNYNQNFPD